MSPLQVSPAEYHSRLKCNRANVFHSDSWLSKSVLWELFDASLWRWRYHPKRFKPTAAMQWGSLIDCMTTTPELVDETVAVMPYDDRKSKLAQAWEAEHEGAGKIVVTRTEYAAARQAAKMLLKTHRKSAEIFRKSSSQVVIGGKIEGLKVKGLVDLAPAGEDFLADLKTTADFSMAGFEKTSARFGYHVQGGVYLAMWNLCHPDDQRERFKLIWQESAEPFEIAVVEIPRDELEQGLKTASWLVARIKKAAEADVWPMLFEEEEPQLRRPTWAAIREEERRGAS
jgi:hypothetical protein